MPEQNTIEQPRRLRCRHIFVDGRRCGSASLRHEEFCRRPAPAPRDRKARRSTVQLPLPEDRASIQLSIGLILQRIATNDLDPRRASLLLYGLQIACSNLPPHQVLPAHALPAPEQPLEEVVADPEHGLLAPPRPGPQDLSRDLGGRPPRTQAPQRARRETPRAPLSHTSNVG